MHGFGYLTHYRQSRPFLTCKEWMAELLACVSHCAGRQLQKLWAIFVTVKVCMTYTLPLLLPCVAIQPLGSVLSPLKPSKGVQYSKNFAFQLLLSQEALRLTGFHWWQSNFFWSVCFDAKNWTQGRGLHILGKDSTIDNPTCTPFISVCCFVSFYFWNKALAGNPGYPWTHDLSVCPFWVSGSHQYEWKMALIFTKV